MILAASIPFRVGRPTSAIMTSGCNLVAFWMASGPSQASATIVHSGRACKISRILHRHGSKSSTTRILAFGHWIIHTFFPFAAQRTMLTQFSLSGISSFSSRGIAHAAELLCKEFVALVTNLNIRGPARSPGLAACHSAARTPPAGGGRAEPIPSLGTWKVNVVAPGQ